MFFLEALTKMNDEYLFHRNSMLENIKLENGNDYLVDKAKMKCLNTILRHNGNINHIELKESNIHGLGLFTKEPIKKGDFITFYPADIVAYETGNGSAAIGYSQRFLEHYENPAEHIKSCNRNILTVDKFYSITASRIFDSDLAYAGHFINDASSKDSLEEYLEEVKEKQNCEFVEIRPNNLHVGIGAIRDIEPGEEILSSYGFHYWENIYKMSDNDK